jgi:FkbM family methyltransferase
MLPPVESVLVKLTQKRDAAGFWGKLLPQPYLYKPGAKRRVVRNGAVFEVDISEAVDWNIYWGLVGGHAWDNFLSHLQLGDTVIDVGANAGEMTLRMAQTVGAQGVVYSIEPQTDNFERLSRNIALNNYPNIQIFQIAFGAARGYVSLAPRDWRNLGTQSVVAQSGIAQDATAIPMTTLDDFVETHQIQAVNGLKIDVEGYECEVLKGALQTIRRFHPVLLLEVIDEYLRAQNCSASQVRQMLTREEYTLLNAETCQPIDQNDPLFPSMADVLAVQDGNPVTRRR